MTKHPSGRELLSINEVVRELDVSRRTVYNWIEQHRIDYIRTPSGFVRIFRDSLYRPSAPKSSFKPAMTYRPLH